MTTATIERRGRPKAVKMELPALGDLDSALAVKSFYHFVQQAWSHVEHDEFIDGWHIKALCEHLEAVSNGTIHRLLINEPPKHMKSLLCGVFWPAWDWLEHPERRFMFASYSHDLSLRDSVKARRLMATPWYKKLSAGGKPFTLREDQNTKTRYDNSRGGYRLSTSVGGLLTGEGGDFIVIDDPHNVIEGESETQRQAVLAWWDESVSTRLHDPKTGAYVLIMQRVHQNDLCGHILKGPQGKHWDHICLPARYEGEDRVVSSLGLCDPRTKEGELLWPMRFGETEVSVLEVALGLYGAAAQLQQRPAPRGGGIFKVGKIRRVKARWVANLRPEDVMARVRYWDTAGTLGGGCESAGVLVLKLKPGALREYGLNCEFVIAHVKAGHWDKASRQLETRRQAPLDGRRTEVWFEQQPGSSGLEAAQDEIRNLPGFRVKADRVTGSKETRAIPLSSQIDAGNVAIVEDAPWTQMTLDQLEHFPRGKFKDRVDGMTGAFAKASRGRTSFVGVA